MQLKRLYFAYGSNMLAAQMQRRCPGAVALGNGRLDGWRFRINRRGTADIGSVSQGAVHGVLWRVAPEHLHVLDGFEGVAIGNYARRAVVVHLATGDAVRAVTYVGRHRWPGRGRVDYLLTAVLPAARQADLPPAYIAEIAAWLPERPVGETRRTYVGRRR